MTTSSREYSMIGALYRWMLGLLEGESVPLRGERAFLSIEMILCDGNVCLVVCDCV